MTTIGLTPEQKLAAEKKISDLAELRNSYKSYLSKLCHVWNDDTDRTICVVTGVTVGPEHAVFFDSSTEGARSYKYAHPLTMAEAGSYIIQHNTSVWDAELTDTIERLLTEREELTALAEKAEAEVTRLQERCSRLQQSKNVLSNKVPTEEDLQQLLSSAEQAPGDFVKHHEFGMLNIIGKAKTGKDLHCCICLADLSFFSAAKGNIKRLVQDSARLRAALTPSDETKAAYMGEVSMDVDVAYHEDSCTESRKVNVSWEAIKKVMGLIRKQAGLKHEG